MNWLTGHSSSPLAACEAAAGTWYPNPRLPPYPLPYTSAPLAQLRPTHNLPTHTITRNSSGEYSGVHYETWPL